MPPLSHLPTLWRTAFALTQSEPAADRAAEAVIRSVFNPARASEGRMLATLVRAADRAGPDAATQAADPARRPPVAWVLARVCGIEPPDIAHALGVPAAEVPVLIALSESSLGGPAAAALRADELSSLLARAGADAGAARVLAATRPLRLRRRIAAVLQVLAFLGAVGLLVYVLLDLQKAAREEVQRSDEGERLSVPMATPKAAPPAHAH